MDYILFSVKAQITNFQLFIKTLEWLIIQPLLVIFTMELDLIFFSKISVPNLVIKRKIPLFTDSFISDAFFLVIFFSLSITTQNNTMKDSF